MKLINLSILYLFSAVQGAPRLLSKVERREAKVARREVKVERRAGLLAGKFASLRARREAKVMNFIVNYYLTGCCDSFWGIASSPYCVMWFLGRLWSKTYLTSFIASFVASKLFLWNSKKAEITTTEGLTSLVTVTTFVPTSTELGFLDFLSIWLSNNRTLSIIQ